MGNILKKRYLLCSNFLLSAMGTFIEIQRLTRGFVWFFLILLTKNFGPQKAFFIFFSGIFISLGGIYNGNFFGSYLMYVGIYIVEDSLI